MTEYFTLLYCPETDELKIIICNTIILSTEQIFIMHSRQIFRQDKNC